MALIVALDVRLDKEKLENGQYCVTLSFSLLLRL